MTEQEIKAQQMAINEASKRGMVLFGGSYDPSVVQNMKSAQSQSFNDEYEQMIQPYIGTEWEDMLRNNPYLKDDYQTTQWDLFSENLGLWQSPRQKATAQRLQLARQYFSDIVAKIQNTEHNSKGSQVAESFAAGQNPDLAGISDSAGMQDSPVPTPDANSYDDLSPISFPQALSGMANVATSCFSSICGMLNTLKTMQLSDSQIQLFGEQGRNLAAQSSYTQAQEEFIKKQSELYNSLIAKNDASTEKDLQDAVRSFIRSSFDGTDFNAGLSEFAKLASDVEKDGKSYRFSELPYAEQVSIYMKDRAAKYASNLSPSIRDRFNSLHSSFFNPNSEEFKTWLSNMRAEQSSGDLRSAESLNLLNAYGEGFGKLQVAALKSQFEMNKEIFEYQKSLYKTYEEKGVISAEAQAHIAELVAKKRYAVVQDKTLQLQEEKLNSLLHIERWLDGRPKFIRGVAQWMLPSVSESMDAMIVSFGQSFGQSRGALMGNPLGNGIAPALGAISGFVK